MRGSRINSNRFLNDPAAIAQAMAWKQEGLPYNWIAAHFEVSTSFLTRELQARGVGQTPSYRTFACTTSTCLPDSFHIIRLYNSGLSCQAIADQLGYDPQAVGSLLKRMGLMRNTRPFQSQIDHQWLDAIDSELKAYFLGLVASDGWLDRNTVFLGLKESDSYILQEIVQRAFPFIPLHRYPPRKMNVEAQVRFSVTSAAWTARLVALGITPAKSLTIGDVTSNIPNEVRHHFVRGYFDGNGSIYHHSYRRKHYVSISIRSTHQFLAGVHSAIGLPIGGIYPKHGDGIKSLVYCGKCRMEQLRDYLYRDATLYLTRKRDRFVW
jgi:hypothetical protein